MYVGDKGGIQEDKLRELSGTSDSIKAASNKETPRSEKHKTYKHKKKKPTSQEEAPTKKKERQKALLTSSLDVSAPLLQGALCHHNSSPPQEKSALPCWLHDLADSTLISSQSIQAAFSLILLWAVTLQSLINNPPSDFVAVMQSACHSPPSRCQ